jgi:hypothetical protein
VWVFFLEDKGETFGFVRDPVLRLRNERHKDAIRAIRSDNGSEFRNSRFETFCHDLGLEHQFSSAYTPPKNGVVERKNMTLCEMAQTMPDEHRTLRRFWAEAVNTACYLLNRIYLRVHKKKTCYELMHGRTPKVSHFHVFGCKCFILKKGKKLYKFEARSVDGIFFGYASHSRAYRVLNLETNQIVETCEVTLTRHSHVVSLSLSVQVMMSLAIRSFKRRSMNLEMMKMAAWCPRLNMYLLLGLLWWTTPLLHLRRQIKIEEKLQLRGR